MKINRKTKKVIKAVYKGCGVLEVIYWKGSLKELYYTLWSIDTRVIDISKELANFLITKKVVIPREFTKKYFKEFYIQYALGTLKDQTDLVYDFVPNALTLI